jgi:adenylate cyclase
MEKLKTIEIDLNVYKIILQFHGRKEPLVVHFDTPSRRFYFSVIALIINEMKMQCKPGFIHIHKYKKELKLLDESLSGKHASKHMDGMLGKIRMAWRHRLPDLETATLFKVLDRDLIPPYEKGGKYRYDCSDDECDIWANLFGYDENNKWRFKFAIDSASISLNDISVTLGDLRDNSAWQEFEKSLSIPPKSVSRKKRAAPRRPKKAVFSLVAVMIIIVVTWAIWNFYIRSVSPMAELELPDKPSIAVLPFDNMSEDAKQEYLADGISENIISALSKISKLFVIDRHSTFTYKGKPIKIQQVSRELGIRYVMEGSVQRSGDRLRVTAQLIDATTGNHLWSERYDRDLKDIFVIQDEIALKILSALQIKLTHGEQARMWAKGTDNLKAYLKLMQAREYYLQMNMESCALARQMAEQAIALDPEYGDACSWLGATHMLDVFLGTSKSPKDSITKAIELTQKALALDDSLAVARSRLGFLYTIIRQHERGVAEAHRGVALNPNSAGAHDYLGFALRFAGRPEEAIPVIKKAIRLNPFPPGASFYNLGMAYLYIGQCSEAISACEKALQCEKDNLLAHITATVAYGMCGKEKEAQETAAGVLRISPNFSCKYFAKKLPYKNQADLDRYIGALKEAGLK